MGFWIYLGGAILALIAGGVLVLLAYGGWNFFRDIFFLKRGIPRNRKGVSEYIKDNQEKFENTDPGFPSEKDKKEVEEDERKRADKYREFEKLRQLELKRRIGAVESPSRNIPSDSELQGRSVFPNVPDSGDTGAKRDNGEAHRRVKLD